MTINNVGTPNTKPQLDSQKLNQQQQAQQSNTAPTKQAQAPVAAPRQDSVSLTQSAQQLTQAQKKATEAPVNQEKVDKLKKAVQSGEYRVNPEQLAQKITQHEADMFGLKNN